MTAALHKNIAGDRAMGLGTQIGYGVGQIAEQIFRDTPSLLLLFFMTTVLGISPAIAGTAIFLPGNFAYSLFQYSRPADARDSACAFFKLSGSDGCPGSAPLYSAAWVASDKIGFALGGTLLVGLVLSGFGFDSTRAVQGLPQSDMALVGVMFAFGFVPAALNLTGAAILAKWGSN